MPAAPFVHVPTRAPLVAVPPHGTPTAVAPGPSLERALEPCERPLPGDFVLTRGDTMISKLIQFGQRLNCHRPAGRVYSWCNHAAIITAVPTRGDWASHATIVEAVGGGVTENRLSVYRPGGYVVVPVEASDEDRRQVVRFVEWTCGKFSPNASAALRFRYGWSAIASIVLYVLFGGRFRFFHDGEVICSALVARALERTGAIFDTAPVTMMPADLARHYGAGAPDEASDDLPKGSSPTLLGPDRCQPVSQGAKARAVSEPETERRDRSF